MKLKELPRRKDMALRNIKQLVQDMEAGEYVSADAFQESSDMYFQCVAAQDEAQRLGITDPETTADSLLAAIKEREDQAKIDHVKKKVDGVLGIGVGFIGSTAGRLLGATANVLGTTGAILAQGLQPQQGQQKP